jgi:hypothetical protein
LWETAKIFQDSIGMPQFDSVKLSCGGNDSIRRVSVFPIPHRRLARDRLRNGYDFKTFEGFVEPCEWVWTWQSARSPFANYFHA